jgi:hypothetical protein
MNTFEAEHPREAGGTFIEKTQSAPETTISLPEPLPGGVWSPVPELVTVDPGDGVYNTVFSGDSYVSFDLERTNLGSRYELFDSLAINRNGGTVRLTATYDNIDFSEVAPNGVEAGDWLGDHQSEIESYLEETYNVLDDNTRNWDESALIAHLTIEAPPADEGAETITVSAAEALASIHEQEKIQQLRKDLADDTFHAKLRDHLSTLAAA